MEMDETTYEIRDHTLDSKIALVHTHCIVIRQNSFHIHIVQCVDRSFRLNVQDYNYTLKFDVNVFANGKTRGGNLR